VVITFDRVTKHYGATSALSEFSLTVPTSKITVLMGLSGSGKTTLIRMVNKMVSPTSGSV
jgi:ABC-type proline/glycine betaine transport system ATPase subunit